MEYMVNVVVIVKVHSEKEAGQYVEQHLKGPGVLIPVSENSLYNNLLHYMHLCDYSVFTVILNSGLNALF
jgi:hypothetical protein